MTDREFIDSINKARFEYRALKICASKYGTGRATLDDQWEATYEGAAYVDYMIDNRFKGHAAITRDGEVLITELA